MKTPVIPILLKFHAITFFKIWLTLAAVLFFEFKGYCQVSFGLKSGVNIATTKDIITFPKNRIGWYAGSIGYIPIYKHFFIQPELIFSSKGYRYKDLSGGEIIAMRLNYLNAPILFGYKIDNKTKAVLGAELGYLIKAINYFNQENISATRGFPKRFDVGLAMGISYDITNRFGGEIRYTYGFKTFYQTDMQGNQRSEAKGGNHCCPGKNS